MSKRWIYFPRIVSTFSRISFLFLSTKSFCWKLLIIFSCVPTNTSLDSPYYNLFLGFFLYYSWSLTNFVISLSIMQFHCNEAPSKCSIHDWTDPGINVVCSRFCHFKIRCYIFVDVALYLFVLKRVEGILQIIMLSRREKRV